MLCKNLNIDDHLIDIGKMVAIASYAKRVTKDHRLSRSACYLIAINGDSKKLEKDKKKLKE